MCKKKKKTHLSIEKFNNHPGSIKSHWHFTKCINDVHVHYISQHVHVTKRDLRKMRETNLSLKLSHVHVHVLT